MWITKPIKKTSHLILLYVFLFTTGIIMQSLLMPLSPVFTEERNVQNSETCQTSTMSLITLAPFTESLLMVWPYKYKKGNLIGVVVWALLHFSMNIPYFIYICIMSIFYMKAIVSEAYLPLIFLHGWINWTSIITCI
jgi:hypothetical protein